MRAVLNAYIALPETPLRWHSADREIARELFRRGVPLEVVDAAFVLGSARRLGRDPHRVVSPIRCVGYFLPIIEEVLVLPPPAALPRVSALGYATSGRESWLDKDLMLVRTRIVPLGIEFADCFDDLSWTFQR